AHQVESGNGNGAPQIPPTLQALLAARIDRLEPDERAVIERASVEGRLFHRGSVQELMPVEAQSDVGSHLLTLVRKEFIRPDRATVPGDDGFRFGHILIRDAAYDSIPKRLRAELHERFARWLESTLGVQAPDEIVGYHLAQAYRYGAELGVPDAELGQRAAEKLAAAAKAARFRKDATAAVTLLYRALELLGSDHSRRRELLAELVAALVDRQATAAWSSSLSWNRLRPSSSAPFPWRRASGSSRRCWPKSARCPRRSFSPSMSSATCMHGSASSRRPTLRSTSSAPSSVSSARR